MSESLVLIIVGIVLLLAGLAKLGSSGGRFRLSNIGINVGSTSTQTAKVGNVASGANARTKKPDWVGFAIAAIGLVTALVGLLKH
jgi:hypothetical protein